MLLDSSFECALDHVDARLLELGADLQFQPAQYPILIPTETLERAGYVAAFPHLLFDATPHESARGMGIPAHEVHATGFPTSPLVPLLRRARRGAILSDGVRGRGTKLEAPRLRSDGGQPVLMGKDAHATPTHKQSLSPAVCFHVFSALSSQTLTAPVRVTARGRCFRHEETVTPGRRQFEFQMREFILLGEKQLIDPVLAQFQERALRLAGEYGLEARWQVANDPFFLPMAKGPALWQRLAETKLELTLADGLAIASINRHQTHFSSRFHITLPSHEPAHSACVAFGLDRWTHAIGKNGVMGNGVMASWSLGVLG